MEKFALCEMLSEFSSGHNFVLATKNYDTFILMVKIYRCKPI